MNPKGDFGLKVSPDFLVTFIPDSVGRAKIIKDPDGNDKTEYYMSFANYGKVIIGEGAKEDLLQHPESVIYEFFEMLGLKNKEIYMCKEWKFKVYESEANEGVEVGYIENGKLCRMNIKEIVALFLHAIRKHVEKSLGFEAKTVKIHIQLGITGEQKKIFLDAVRLIGLIPV